MSHKLRVCCGLVLASLTTAAPAADVNEFIDFSLTNSSSVLLPGRLYVPPEATVDPTRSRPLIVWLHGGGARGNNNLNQISGDVDLLFAEAKRRGAFLYAPQAPLNWRPRAITDRVMTMLDRAVADFNVNPDRLYLTGYSSGGGGVWNMLSRYVDRFAAAVPVAPVSAEPDFRPANLVDQPIYAFHARNDSITSVHTTRNVISSILASAGESAPTYPAPGDPHFFFDAQHLDLHYLEPASGDHSVHFGVYQYPPMYDWMFSHGVAVPEPRSVVMAAFAVTAMLAASRRR